MNKKIIVILFGLLLIKASFGALIVDADSPVYGENITVNLDIYNNNDERYCYDLYAESSDNDLELKISPDSYCLSAYGRTTAKLRIDARDADSGLHRIYIYDGSRKVESIDFYKENDSSNLNVWISSKNICKNKDTYVFVNIENESSRVQEISLSADNEMLLPYFEDSEIILDGYEEENLKLYINTYGIREGTHSVRIRIRTDYETIYKTFDIKVSDCAESDGFYIKTSECFNTEKGKTKQVWFKLVNEDDYSKTIYLSLSGDLEINYPSSVKLSANQTKYVYVDVKTKNSDSAGTHNIRIKAWSFDEEETSTFCIRVGKETDYTINVPSSIIAEECTTEVIPIEIKNTGDLKVKVNMKFEGIEYKFSKNNFYIQEDDSEIVYLAVVPPKQGLYYGVLEVSINGKKETFSIEIDARKNSTANGDLQISYPKKIVLEKDKTSLEFTILNLSNSDKELMMSIDLPSEFFYNQPYKILVKAGETHTVKIDIEFDGEVGTYNGNIYLGEEEYPITFVVFEEEKQENNVDFTGVFSSGFFTLAGNTILGLVVLFIALVLMGAFFSKKTEEVWLKR